MRELVHNSHGPGAVIDGRVIHSWRCTSTTTRYDSRGAVSSIVVEFTDGSHMFAESVRPLGR